MEKEVVISYLEVASRNWLESRAAAERAGHMSATLNEIESRDMAAVDTLLEELHGLGAIALQNS